MPIVDFCFVFIKSNTTDTQQSAVCSFNMVPIVLVLTLCNKRRIPLPFSFASVRIPNWTLSVSQQAKAGFKSICLCPLTELITGRRLWFNLLSLFWSAFSCIAMWLTSPESRGWALHPLSVSSGQRIGSDHNSSGSLGSVSKHLLQSSRALHGLTVAPDPSHSSALQTNLPLGVDGFASFASHWDR